MIKVGIAGYGTTKFSLEDFKIESILLKSTKSLFDSTPNLSQKDVDAVLVSTNNNTKYLSPILSELAGIQPKISHTIENLCNSGTNALVSGYSYISSGLADTVLISGGERFDSPGQVLDWDISRGEFKHPIFWGSIFTKSYTREFSISNEDLALVPVKNHKLAQNNPNALSHKLYSLEDVLNSKKITADLRILDCSRSCTGGASILLASEEKCKTLTDNPIWITGIGQKTISAGFTKNNLTHLDSPRLAGYEAIKMAKCEINDIDVAEIHDAFSVCEPMILEALGFSKRGKGMELVSNLYETNSPKINPRGGLIGSGHPLGATGLAQTIEITQQLQNCAGKRQVSRATAGLVHNMSAAATSSTILVLKNEI